MNDYEKAEINFDGGISSSYDVYGSSCEKGNPGIILSIKSDIDALGVKKSTSAAAVVISDFAISIRDVEFKLDGSEFDSSEVHFRGPYEVNLLLDGDALTQTIGDVDVEQGTYDVLRFKLHKSRDWAEESVLYDRSIFLAGTIDGVPFEFWHDTSENFDFENSDGIVVSEGDINIVVKFHIDMFLSSVQTIDLSQAVDADEDGLIEINPDNDDGNGDLADQLKDNIKKAADLIKE